MYNDVDALKHELMEILGSLDKDAMDLCCLKDYADILKTVSEIKGKDYTEILASMVTMPAANYSMADNRIRALGPRTIRDFREGKKDREEDDDE